MIKPNMMLDLLTHINELCQEYEVTLKAMTLLGEVYASLKEDYDYVIGEEDIESMYPYGLYFGDGIDYDTQIRKLRNLIINKHNLNEDTDYEAKF